MNFIHFLNFILRVANNFADFALALLVGVIVGTYSSSFIASPIVYLWLGRQTEGARSPAGRTTEATRSSTIGT